MFNTLCDYICDFWNFIHDWYIDFEYKQKLWSLILLILLIMWATTNTDGGYDITPLVFLGPLCIFAFFTKDTII